MKLKAAIRTLNQQGFSTEEIDAGRESLMAQGATLQEYHGFLKFVAAEAGR